MVPGLARFHSTNSAVRSSTSESVCITSIALTSCVHHMHHSDSSRRSECTVNRLEQLMDFRLFSHLWIRVCSRCVNNTSHIVKEFCWIFCYGKHNHGVLRIGGGVCLCFFWTPQLFAVTVWNGSLCKNLAGKLSSGLLLMLKQTRSHKILFSYGYHHCFM